MNAEISGFFRIFENDIHILTSRSMLIARFIRYFSLQNQPDGFFSGVLEKNAFIALAQIELFDITAEERAFLNIVNHEYDNEKQRLLVTMIVKLIRLFDLWLLSVSRSQLNGQTLGFHDDIRNQIAVNLKLPVARLLKYTHQEYPEIQLPNLKGFGE